MSNLKLPLMSFDNLSAMDVPASGKIAHNTWIRRSPGLVEVVYHATVIAIIYRDCVVISNGGWHTPTTANRLNAITRDNGFGFVNIRQGKMFYTPKGYNFGSESVLVSENHLLVSN